MDTLIAMGTGAAWFYSMLVVLAPNIDDLHPSLGTTHNRSNGSFHNPSLYNGGILVTKHKDLREKIANTFSLLWDFWIPCPDQGFTFHLHNEFFQYI